MKIHSIHIIYSEDDDTNPEVISWFEALPPFPGIREFIQAAPTHDETTPRLQVVGGPSPEPPLLWYTLTAQHRFRQFIQRPLDTPNEFTWVLE